MTDTAAQPRRWLITGVSSGLGRALAEHVLARGEVVVGTLRKADQLSAFAALAPGRAIPLKLDITDDAAGRAAEGAAAEAGGVDVLVNNAGYSLMGAIEDISLAEARREMETNFFGAMKVTQAVLPHMRAQGHGRIINNTSVAAVVGFPMNGLYAASKAALSGFSEALAAEVGRFGIRVTIIEAGGFRTEFGAGSLVWAERTSPDYAQAVAGFKERMAGFAKAAANDPRKGAAAIAALADLDEPPLHLTLGADGYKLVTGALQSRLSEYERLADFAAHTAYDG